MAALRPGEEPDDDLGIDSEQDEIEAGDEEVEETETEPGDEETEAEGEAEPAEGEAEELLEEPAPKPPSRAARRIQALSDEVKKTRRELDEIKRQPNRPDPNALAEQQRREAAEEETVNLSGDPSRIAKYYSERATRQADQKFNGLAAHLLDTSDKTTFNTLVSSNPVYAQVADEVEDRLAQARAAGMNPQRVAIAHLIMGERVAKRAKPAATRQRKAAATNNARQQARPGNGRSDTGNSRRPSGDNQSKRASRLDESGLL